MTAERYHDVCFDYPSARPRRTTSFAIHYVNLEYPVAEVAFDSTKIFWRNVVDFNLIFFVFCFLRKYPFSHFVCFRLICVTDWMIRDLSILIYIYFFFFLFLYSVLYLNQYFILSLTTLNSLYLDKSNLWRYLCSNTTSLVLHSNSVHWLQKIMGVQLSEDNILSRHF